MDDGSGLPPGWYPDERFPDDERWWDGERWGASRPAASRSATAPDGGRTEGRRRRKLLVIGATAVLIVGALLLALARNGGTGHPVLASSTDPPAGRSYAFLRTYAGEPVRHSPCRPLNVLWNTALAPAEQPLLQQALDEFTRATGITVIDGGETDTIPGGLHHPLLDRSNQSNSLTIAIAERLGASASRYLAQPDREAIGVAGFVDGTAGTITASYVVIDAAVLPSLSPAARYELYLHELGHAMGLAHVSDPGEVMYPRLHSPPLPGYAAGDLAGLAILGDRTSCPAAPAG